MYDTQSHQLMGTWEGWINFLKSMFVWLLIAFAVGAITAGYFIIDWDGNEYCTPNVPVYVGPDFTYDGADFTYDGADLATPPEQINADR